jgi:hypothetical protein
MKPKKQTWKKGRYAEWGKTPFGKISAHYDGFYGKGYVGNGFGYRKDGFETIELAKKWVQQLFEKLLNDCFEQE